MLNTYKFYSKNDKGLTAISAHQASDLISKYNIYFKTLAIPTDEHRARHFSFDAIDHNLYQIDNLKSFDKQYQHIKTITFPDVPTVSFFTDYKENPLLVKHRLELACEVLKSKSKSINLTNLKSESKLEKVDVLKYINSLEKNQTPSLFDTENNYEGISPNIKKEVNNKQPKGVSSIQINQLNNTHFDVGLKGIHS